MVIPNIDGVTDYSFERVHIEDLIAGDLIVLNRDKHSGLYVVRWVRIGRCASNTTFLRYEWKQDIRRRPQSTQRTWKWKGNTSIYQRGSTCLRHKYNK